MSVKKVGFTIVTIAIAIVAVLGYKYFNKSRAGQKVRVQAQELVQKAPGYEKDKPYYDSLLEQVHPAAFDSSYKMGGRRTSSKFDEDKYLDTLFNSMIKKAKADGRNDAAAALMAVQLTLRLGASGGAKAEKN